MNKSSVTFLVAVFLLAACAAPQPTPTAETPAGQVFVDQAQLLVLESYPVQIHLQVQGNLPTPCHELHYEVAQPDADNQIAVTAWSEVDPAMACTQVLQPFEQSIDIPMEDQPDGNYSVWLNGDLVGEFSYPG